MASIGRPYRTAGARQEATGASHRAHALEDPLQPTQGDVAIANQYLFRAIAAHFVSYGIVPYRIVA
jgi:hypothetical protein